MDKLLTRLHIDYPQLTFVAGKTFLWSPKDKQITYKVGTGEPSAVFSLLHELGHATLDHQHFSFDFQLINLEVAAWEAAKQLARGYGITINEDHIQDCLDSYRDWLYRRSICPSCTAKSLQVDGKPLYKCFNCGTSWRVANSRFCRPYRQTDHEPKRSEVTFALQNDPSPRG